MTDTDDEPNVEDTGDSVPPRKWCWWFLPSMVAGFWANVARACACLCDEISLGFACHGLWKQQSKDEKREREEDTEVVSRFREQLTEL